MMELPLREGVGRVYTARVGHLWRVHYLVHGSVLYAFEGEVLGVVKTHITLVRLLAPDPKNIKKIQRRDFLRMPIKLDVTLEAEDSRYALHGVTIDVSGGGMAVSCHPKTPVQKGDKLSGFVHLPDDGGGHRDAGVSVEVVRVQPAQEKEARKICYCKFTTITPNDQSAIIRLCNKRQRELHKMGLDQ